MDIEVERLSFFFIQLCASMDRYNYNASALIYTFTSLAIDSLIEARYRIYYNIYVGRIHCAAASTSITQGKSNRGSPVVQQQREIESPIICEISWV